LHNRKWFENNPFKNQGINFITIVSEILFSNIPLALQTLFNINKKIFPLQMSLHWFWVNAN
jgi:hypothetical protein